jgi:hypothetical protein
MKILVSVEGTECVVDDDVFEWASTKRWRINDSGYFVCGGGNNKKRLHRLIMNEPEGFDIDHVNGNKLDNLRSNLRICSRQENNYNRGVRSDNTTGFRGVWFDKRTGRFRCEIKKEGKKYSLGTYKTAAEAANAYNYKATELFGEFAWLNEV